MAARGFVAIAFDPSYTGESGGEPRNIASPDINTEDFSAAVDFLGLQPFVDRNRIGIIGICGWGSMALNATAVDKRIKTVVTSTMYDMTRVMSKGYNDSVTLEQRTQTLERLSQQRWVDAENGKPAYQPPYNDLKGGEAQFLVDYHDYYRTPRGYLGCRHTWRPCSRRPVSVTLGVEWDRPGRRCASRLGDYRCDEASVA
jgi:fermentation-respiration switch protein FrsA (DUF1100 family)